MSVQPHHEPAAPVYAEIRDQIDCTKRCGSTRQRFNVEMWEPAVEAHRPGGPLVGDECRQCGQPWPCQFLRNLLKSGLVAGHGPLS